MQYFCDGTDLLKLKFEPVFHVQIEGLQLSWGPAVVAQVQAAKKGKAFSEFNLQSTIEENPDVVKIIKPGLEVACIEKSDALVESNSNVEVVIPPVGCNLRGMVANFVGVKRFVFEHETGALKDSYILSLDVRNANANAG